MYQRIIVGRDKLLLSRFDTWPIAASIEFDDPTSCWMAIKKWPVIIGIKRWTKKQKNHTKKEGGEGERLQVEIWLVEVGKLTRDRKKDCSLRTRCSNGDIGISICPGWSEDLSSYTNENGLRGQGRRLEKTSFSGGNLAQSTDTPEFKSGSGITEEGLGAKGYV